MLRNPFSLKVMTFNISSGKTENGVLDLELTASAIEQGNPDIAGLQEVDQHFSERSEFMDQVAWLAQRLGMFVVYGPNLQENRDEDEQQNGQFGNAILSKHPILSYENHHVTAMPMQGRNNEPRGLLEAIVEKDGTRFAFFTTHLSLKDKELNVNIEEIIDISNKQDLPLILTGDFNASLDSTHIEKMKSRFSHAFRGGSSYPDTYKKKGDHGEKIDYIFYDSNWEVRKAEVIDTEASDHYPLLAELQLFTET